MFEKVNPGHPDKIADRIAGAMVDMAYTKSDNPHIAVEVLIGHGVCHIIAETDTAIDPDAVSSAVSRIAGDAIDTDILLVAQDEHLADNQREEMRCGDNGIFAGSPVTEEQMVLTSVADDLWNRYHTDGKYIINDNDLIICQSHAERLDLEYHYPGAVVNPLGYWTGGMDTDTGATNRKLGSDLGDAVTGGGLHGKDLSKADVSITIYAHILAQRMGKPVQMTCAIGDTTVDGKPYHTIVDTARDYIETIGGFEKLAEWGLIRWHGPKLI